MLHEMLSELSKRYTYERGKPFVDSEFGNFVRYPDPQEDRRIPSTASIMIQT